MWTKKFFFCVFLFFPAFVYSQDTNDFSSADHLKLLSPQYHLSIGSSFMYFSTQGSGMNFFAAPNILVPLTKRISVNGGIIFSNNIINSNLNNELSLPVRNLVGLDIYGSTIYQLTPKIVLYGAAMKQFLSAPGNVNHPLISQDSYTFGSSLKISKGITIDASVHISEGYPFYPPMRLRNSNTVISPYIW